MTVDMPHAMGFATGLLEELLYQRQFIGAIINLEMLYADQVTMKSGCFCQYG